MQGWCARVPVGTRTAADCPSVPCCTCCTSCTPNAQVAGLFTFGRAARGVCQAGVRRLSPGTQAATRLTGPRWAIGASRRGRRRVAGPPQMGPRGHAPHTHAAHSAHSAAPCGQPQPQPIGNDPGSQSRLPLGTPARPSNRSYGSFGRSGQRRGPPRHRALALVGAPRGGTSRALLQRHLPCGVILLRGKTPVLLMK
jgi:hypothetical protein